MSIALITQPTLLRKYFAYTRQGLLGKWPTVSSRATAEEPNLPEVLPEAFEILPEIEKTAFPTLPPVHTQFVAELGSKPIVQAPPAVAETVPVVQTASVAEVQPQAEKTTQLQTAWWKPVVKFMLSAVIATSLLVAAVIIVPELYSKVFSNQSSVSQVADAAKQGVEEQPQKSAEPKPYMPPKNPDLPTGTWVSIPRIGVHSEVLATENPDEALNKGVWMVPDFGRPGDYSQPTIVAAHRYGWDWWWQSDYWKYNSFYLLTETEPGDIVEVIHDQRKWTYEIYAGEEGELITDYSADLILYTCKYLNSPIRHFRYAKLIIPE